MQQIFHILIGYPGINGDIKTHFRLAELERELGFESYISFINSEISPTWFSYSCPVIEFDEVEKKISKNDILIFDEDSATYPVFNKFDNVHKICYVQRDVFYKGDEFYHGIHLWFNSIWNSKCTVLAGSIINPFVDDNIFKFSPLYFHNDFLKILIPKNPKGKIAWNHIRDVLPTFGKNFFRPTILQPTSEKQFAIALQNSHAFFAYNYPRGFGLSTLEAMASGAFVFGFTGGGGLDYMKDGVNCMFSSDGIYKSTSLNLLRFTALSNTKKEKILEEGLYTSKLYSKKNTKNQLINALEKINATV